MVWQKLVSVDFYTGIMWLENKVGRRYRIDVGKLGAQKVLRAINRKEIKEIWVDIEFGQFPNLSSVKAVKIL
ncbi:MAG: hypothetical protein ACTSPL_04150 [Candidatus Odinarchaeia archaeon]